MCAGTYADFDTRDVFRANQESMFIYLHMQKASNICLRHSVDMNVGLSRRRPFVQLMMPRSYTHCILIFSHQPLARAFFEQNQWSFYKPLLSARQNDSICAER
jgi:hypothetical protein